MHTYRYMPRETGNRYTRDPRAGATRQRAVLASPVTAGINSTTTTTDSSFNLITITAALAAGKGR
jgi:hypothetical protein